MRLGPYETLGELGRGGRGTVYRARSPGGVEVAVKLLRLDRADAFARFEREYRLQTKLGAEEGFVPILDAGSVSQGPFIVMPLLPGGTLRERIMEGALDVAGTVALGEALARALSGAHGAGIIHRDLKPENILFTAAKRPVIADLGLAKYFGVDTATAPGERGLSHTGELRGTPGYMAPEQMVDSRHVGPPADVYAVGAVLYECLAGTPLFVGDSWTEVACKVQSGEFEPIGKLKPDAPPWLVALIERCLAKKPDQRFADGRELLGAFLSRSAPRAEKPPSRILLPAVAASTALLGLAAGALVFRSKEAPPPQAAPPTVAVETSAAAPAPPPPPTIDPRLVPETWIEKARAKLAKGDTDGAISDYGRALELDEKCVVALDERAQARIKKMDTVGILADTDKALKLDPNRATVWCSRGFARLKKGDHDKAIADARRALELDPNLAAAWRNRGVARGKKGDIDGEIADCTRAIELEPKFATAWFNRASAYTAKGDREKAIADFEKVLELDPGSAMAKQRLELLRKESAAR